MSRARGAPSAPTFAQQKGALGQRGEEADLGAGELGRRTSGEVCAPDSLASEAAPPAHPAQPGPRTPGDRVCTLRRSEASAFFDRDFPFFFVFSPGKLTAELGMFWVPRPQSWLRATGVMRSVLWKEGFCDFRRPLEHDIWQDPIFYPPR